jgi:hypothetical protein
MAYDELLAVRMWAALGPLPGLVEKKMFGGVCFLINGNMACGVHKDNMIVRVGSQNYAAALAIPHTHPFDITGRPMAGWIMVGPAGSATESGLKAWLEQGLAFASSLPPK